jgi:hypothetical protein
MSAATIPTAPPNQPYIMQHRLLVLSAAGIPPAMGYPLVAHALVLLSGIIDYILLAALAPTVLRQLGPEPTLCRMALHQLPSRHGVLVGEVVLVIVVLVGEVVVVVVLPRQL